MENKLTEERYKELLYILDVETAHPKKPYPQEILDLAKLSDRKVIELEADGISFKNYLWTPKELPEKAPLFINIHGGGWYIGHEPNDDAFCSWLADYMHGVIFDLDYTCSKDADIEVMEDQCWAACLYAREHCEEWGCDPKRISVGGYSAGGHLTAVLTQRDSAENKPVNFALQINAYGPVDMRPSRPVEPQNEFEAKMSKRGDAFNELCWRGNMDACYDPRISPILASDAVLCQQPRTLIITAGHCPFKGQGEELANRLMKIGVETTIKCFVNSSHGFIPHFGVDWEPAGKLMAKYICESYAE